LLHPAQVESASAEELMALEDCPPEKGCSLAVISCWPASAGQKGSDRSTWPGMPCSARKRAAWPSAPSGCPRFL